MFIIVYSVMKCSNFILLHIAVQFFEHQLVERLYFSHCIFLPPVSAIRCPRMQGFISQLSILFHWSILLFLCQCHALWITVALCYSLKLHKLIPPAVFILFKKCIYFNWRLITLQYCSGFCHTLTWMSHGFTCVPHPEPTPPPSPSHPSVLSQCTSPDHPVSCIKPGLMICFTSDNIHVSIYSLKSSHPHLLPQRPKDCSIHLCLFCCLIYGIIIMKFLNSIYMG